MALTTRQSMHSGEIREKVLRHVYQEGLHEFTVIFDLGKIDASLFMKALRSAQSRSTASYGAITIEHVGKIPHPRKVSAP